MIYKGPDSGPFYFFYNYFKEIMEPDIAPLCVYE